MAEDRATFISVGPEGVLSREALALLPAYVVRIDGDDRITYVNRTRGEHRSEDVLGASFFDFIGPSFRELTRAAIERVRETGEPGCFRVAVGRRVYDAQAFPDTLSDGARDLVLFGIDVSEGIRRETAEAKLRMALDVAKLGSWEYDYETGKLTLDERIQSMLGVKGDAFDGRDLMRMVHPDDLELLRQRSLAAEPVAFVHRVILDSGELRWFRSMSRPELDGEGHPRRILGATIDVTEERNQRDRMLQSQKLEAIGTLTAGIAHNFRNTLAVLRVMHHELLPVVPASHAEVLDDMDTALSDATRTTEQLMEVAGQRERAHLPLRLDEVVENAMRLCRRTLSRSMRIVIDLESPVWIDGDATGLQQMMLNLVINARDALEGEHDPRIEVTLKREGAYARMTVSDNGPGMSDAVASRVFEPFFSTKGNAGTGLGLSTSAGIARVHNGSIDVQSAPGRGAAFTVRLPLRS